MLPENSGTGGGKLYSLPSDLKMLPSHGPEYQKQTAGAALSYISGHFLYVVAFFFLTLAIYWSVGAKAAFYFLLLVLLGQLMSNADYLQQLFKG